MRTALTYFASRSDDYILAEALGITKAMKNNTNFKNPTPSLKEVEKITQEYSSCLSVLKETPTKLDFLNKKERRLELNSCLSALGKYVNYSANGNLYMLESSGFRLSKPTTAVGILNAPAFIHVRESQRSGEVAVEVAKVPRAFAYSISYKTADEPTYQSRVISTTKGVVADLKSGEKYYFKATAISRASTKGAEYNFCDEVTRFVQ